MVALYEQKIKKLKDNQEVQISNFQKLQMRTGTLTQYNSPYNRTKPS